MKNILMTKLMMLLVLLSVYSQLNCTQNILTEFNFIPWFLVLFLFEPIHQIIVLIHLKKLFTHRNSFPFPPPSLSLSFSLSPCFIHGVNYFYYMISFTLSFSLSLLFSLAPPAPNFHSIFLSLPLQSNLFELFFYDKMWY